MGTSKIDARSESGRRAEEAAAARYQQQGYSVLDRNWSCRGGELDLVALRDGVLAFVEVRSVSTDFLPGAEVSVTATKQARVCLAAELWLGANEIDYTHVRFDVVAVRFRRFRSPAVECFEDAFLPPWAV